MMKKTLATVMLLSSFAFSHSVFAGGLEGDMKTLGKNYKAFNKAENSQAATTALTKVPTSTALFEQIIVEIDKANALVQAGKLDEAKKQGKKIAELRDQGHKHYAH